MVPPDSTGIPRAPAYSGTLPPPYSRFAYGTLTLSGVPFQAPSATLSLRLRKAPQPPQGLTPTGLGSSPFARRYLGNLWFDFSSSRYLDVSVPWVGFPLGMTWYYPCRVSPFGHPRIDARLQLPEASRSLPRPSSPAHA